jgi:hypothetical protein
MLFFEINFTHNERHHFKSVWCIFRYILWNDHHHDQEGDHFYHLSKFLYFPYLFSPTSYTHTRQPLIYFSIFDLSDTNDMRISLWWFHTCVRCALNKFRTLKASLLKKTGTILKPSLSNTLEGSTKSLIISKCVLLYKFCDYCLYFTDAANSWHFFYSVSQILLQCAHIYFA